MMGIDGTWRRKCKIIDVSQTGARLHIEGYLEGLDLKELFFLLLVSRIAAASQHMLTGIRLLSHFGARHAQKEGEEAVPASRLSPPLLQR
jgi:hypothetical protein